MVFTCPKSFQLGEPGHTVLEVSLSKGGGA